MKTQLLALLATIVLQPAFAAGGGGPTVVVVCPRELAQGLDQWRAYRQRQGVRVDLVEPRRDPPTTAAAVRQTFDRLDAEPDQPASARRFVLLVGDASASGVQPFFQRAEVVQHYGPEGWLATDHPYGELSGDDDAAVGRVPVDSVAELRSYLARVVVAETRPACAGDAELRLVAGVGGFGAVIDGAIEAAATSALTTKIDPAVRIRLTRVAQSADDEAVGEGAIDELADGLSTPAFAWAYLGHGTREALVPSIDSDPERSPLSAAERLLASRSGAAAHGPNVAILLACYGAAIDSPKPSVAERLIGYESGPLAVIGSTRVSMPLGNAVLGSAMLAAANDSATVGELLRAARRTALSGSGDDSVVGAMRRVAASVGGAPETLDAEVRDHVAMVTLLGDPLLAQRPMPQPIDVVGPPAATPTEAVTFAFDAPAAGEWRAEVRRAGRANESGPALRVATAKVDRGTRVEAAIATDGDGRFAPLPAGRYAVRVVLTTGAPAPLVGSTTFRVAAPQVASRGSNVR
ncbi:MAG: C25 family cysteine peptidase [Lacipirellulaceae bacterium]